MANHKKSRSELKREAILAAAKQAFQKDGVQNTSMDNIAATAQVSKRTVYNHFKNKEELVAHIISEFWAQLHAGDPHPFSVDIPLAVQLGKLVESHTKLVSCAGYIALTRVAFGYYLYHPSELKRQIDKTRKQQSALHRWIEVAIEQRCLIAHDVELGVRQIHNLIEGRCFWQQFLGIESPVSQQEQQRINQDTVSMYLSQYASDNNAQN